MLSLLLEKKKMGKTASSTAAQVSLIVRHFFTCQPHILIPIMHACTRPLKTYCCHCEWNQNVDNNTRKELQFIPENEITVIHCVNMGGYWIERAWKCRINCCRRLLSAEICFPALHPFQSSDNIQWYKLQMTKRTPLFRHSYTYARL